jgi:hypothetical protein
MSCRDASLTSPPLGSVEVESTYSSAVGRQNSIHQRTAEQGDYIIGNLDRLLSISQQERHRLLREHNVDNIETFEPQLTAISAHRWPTDKIRQLAERSGIPKEIIKDSEDIANSTFSVVRIVVGPE